MNAGIFGKWPGICVDIEDPEGLKRIKVRVPGIFGQEILEEWALPCLPPGIDTVPEKGDGVWVEFIGGDENKPIWSGVWFNKNAKPGAEFKTMVNDAFVAVFNDHAHGADGKPTTKITNDENDTTNAYVTTKVKGR